MKSEHCFNLLRWSYGFLDPAEVVAFLESSRKPGFSQDSEWRRLLTLELGLSGITVSSSV